MPKYKPANFDQITMIPVDFKTQLSPGTFEYTLEYLIENELDLSAFDNRYKNDETGASAYNPRILLKVILMAYSRGITSSRSIERLCRENIIFMALSRDSRPHFTTIAGFVTHLPMEIDEVFGGIVALCDEMGLIGKNMFALDGCKISSNASKELSGTKESFQKRAEKMKTVVQRLRTKHREEDESDDPPSPDTRRAEEKQIGTIKKKMSKLEKWLAENEDRRGKRNKVIQSNITDNESAKLKTSNGVIQGYNGIAMNDDKHQVIVAADAIGQNDERPTVQPLVEEVRERFEEDPFKTAKLSADTGFCVEGNLAYLYENEIDAYIPDKNFRKRDERFADAAKHYPKERKKKADKFYPEDFIVDPVNETVTCPVGKRMWLKSRNPKKWGIPAIQFQARVADCKACSFRKRCLRREDQKTPRQFVWFKTSDPKHHPYTKRMIKKIDTDEGRREYSKRLGAIEPVFANITSNLGLKWFSLRGRTKVRAQWIMFCLVHNIGKIQRYGTIE